MSDSMDTPESYDLSEAPPARPASPPVPMPSAPTRFEEGVEAPPRRGFLRKAAAIAIGAVATVIPGAAGLLVFTDPLRRQRGAAEFLPVAPLDAVPADGTPRKFQLVVEKVDAWNTSKDVASVYLIRDPDSQTLACYSTSCPHAGCAVDWVAGASPSEGKFECPCHKSAFRKDGSLTPGSVSPRGLDPLEVDPEALKEGLVRVKYQEFLAGMHDRKVKA